MKIEAQRFLDKAPRYKVRLENKVPKVARSYARFCKDFAAKNPKILPRDRFRATAAAWKQLPEAEREEYRKLARDAFDGRRVLDAQIGIESVAKRGRPRAAGSEAEPARKPRAGQTAPVPAAGADEAPVPTVGDDEAQSHGTWSCLTATMAPAPAVEDEAAIRRAPVMMLWGDLTWSLSSENVLGRGAYGDVYVATHASGIRAAAKVYHDGQEASREDCFCASAMKEIPRAVRRKSLLSCRRLYGFTRPPRPRARWACCSWSCSTAT